MIGVSLPMRRRIGLVLAIVLIMSAILLPDSLVLAAGEGSNITTSPIAVDLAIKPGETKSTTLQVQNNGPRTTDIKVEATTFTAKNETGEAAINPKSTDPSLQWVSFSPSVVTAEPGVWKKVEMTISIPKDASLGYYYAVLFKPVLSTDGIDKSSNTISPSNAVLVLVDTSTTNESRNLSITSFTSTKKVYEYLPATFNLNIRNNGNIFLAPKGVIYISKDASFKSTIATIDFNKANGRILPHSNRIFTVNWDDGFPVFQNKTSLGKPVVNKKGQPVQQLNWDFTKTNSFRIGKFYARAALVYNNGTRDIPVYSVVSFWVIPWKLILVIFAIVLIQIFFISRFIRYRRMYKKDQKAQKAKQ